MEFLPRLNINKSDGIFTDQGFQLYECRENLARLMVTGTRLVLNIQPDSGKTLVSSVIDYVEPPKIVAPKQGIYTRLDFYPEPFDVRFEDPPEFVRYELHVQFNILNILNNGDTVKQMVDKVFTRNSENPGRPRYISQVIVNIPGDLILAKVKQDVGANPDVAYRIPGKIEFILFTASSAYFDYIDLNKMSDDYGGRIITNVTGGIGVFAFKYLTKVSNFYLGPFTMDSLLHGRFTQNLKFKDW